MAGTVSSARMSRPANAIIARICRVEGSTGKGLSGGIAGNFIRGAFNGETLMPIPPGR